MITGPIFSREVTTLPRRPRFYIVRALYVAALFGLVLTALLMLIGNQEVRNLGDWARFGVKVFQILAPLQLALATLMAAMVTAAAVAYEKDRRTFVLLLLTKLTNRELVLGKLFASLLNVLVMVLAGLPIFMLVALFGGVSYGQVARMEMVSIASVLAAGSLGSTIALWREKTFQALAITILTLVVWILVWELISAGSLGSHWWGIPTSQWAMAASPWHAILAATRPEPVAEATLFVPIWISGDFLVVAIVIAAVLNLLAILRLRAWNAELEVSRNRQDTEGIVAVSEAVSMGEVPPVLPEQSAGKIRHPSRNVWENPILWREIRTWAFGKKILTVRLVYLGLAIATAVALWGVVQRQDALAELQQIIPPAAKPLIPLCVLSFVLVNALAVTSLTSERDSRALDLLLVTDLSPKEFVYGKLGGVLYNAKEMILLPLLLCLVLVFSRHLSVFNFLYLFGGLIVMYAFAAVLGIHSGITYASSRTAIATSLGTLMFLFLGVATCMRMMVAFKGSYLYQLGAFSAFLGGGGLGLCFALGLRNPSQAIWLSSLFAPFATFFVITSFMLKQYGAMFLVTLAVYGGATAAMLVPAVSEFDVALGRTGENVTE
ncbi:MAG: hypothetical protein JW829_20010 [Pirellulales bacterium]|nr:hypothetical protein [Pirellulales bacterium]